MTKYMADIMQFYICVKTRNKVAQSHKTNTEYYLLGRSMIC